MFDKKKFYVTTPIYYVTARPHLGSLYSTLLADVANRWNKIRGCNTFFLTGTDEHGQKVAQAAQKAGLEPKEFVSSFISDFKEMWRDYEIEYSHFIRTTDESHKKAVQEWIKRLLEKGDIYKSFYSGFYCTPCETYLTEKDEGEEKDGKPLCSSCQRETSYVSEESYFFRLSAYQEKLLDFYSQNPDFVTPSQRLNEVISFVKAGLKDLSISRTTVKWGIPFPDDAKHVTYVWADALNNYITAIGYSDKNREKEFNYWWPADLQILGKDILRFHAIYWPAFLMASGLKLPKKLLVHGWIKVDNKKMSKSFGNIVEPKTLLDAYGSESVRYYLTRHISITQDSEFSIKDLEQRINSDLANDLGNLLNRMILLALKRGIEKVEPPKNWASDQLNLRSSFWTTLNLIINDVSDAYFDRALSNLWKFINQVNSYFHSKAPWKIKDDKEFKEVISATCHSLYSIAILLWPVMPNKMSKLLKSLGINLELNGDFIEDLKSNPWNKTFKLSKTDMLFKKIEIEKKFDSQEEVVQEIQNIDFKDFSKVMLLAGTIIECQDLPKSKKILKLKVDFGSKGTREILAGIKEHFAADELLNKQAVFVYNLEPKKIMGHESQGMMLIAESDGKLSLITPEISVKNGSRLR